MVSMIETGRNVPSLERAKQAAVALQTSTDYLVGLTNDPTPAAELSRKLAILESRAGLVPIVGEAAASGPRKNKRTENE